MRDRTVLLTGASRGIGHATAKRFVAAGWRVITCSRGPLPPECQRRSGIYDHIEVDFSDPVSTQHAVHDAHRRLPDGKLDALVNNAGLSPKSSSGARLGALSTSPHVWEEVFQVNFFAPLMLSIGLISHLEAARGAIVNVTSIAATRVHPFASAAYATSKAALTALTRELASDAGARGVRVNSIAPGEIQTSMLSSDSKYLTSEIPMGRFGSPDEVASLIIYLCSPQASYINGAEVHIDGGQIV